jgi:D-glycero-alpha-D-manno-heptose-7-phosphate kinase
MRVKSRAPLRVGLAGGGTDLESYYSNFGGLILNCTIDKYANVELEKNNKNHTTISMLDLGDNIDIDFNDLKYEKNNKFCLAIAVYKFFTEKFMVGYVNLKITTYVDAPAGSGLGTSSTLVVALVSAFSNFYNIPLGEYEIADISFEIEREKLKLVGGKQDQYSASFGGLNLMEFKKNGDTLVNPLRLNQNIIAELETRMIMFYTGTSRSSEKIIVDQMSSVSNNSNALEAMHDLKKNAIEIKEALLKADFDLFGKLLHEGWVVKRRTSASISNSFIDEIYLKLLENGVLGGKVSGAGGGGYLTLFTKQAGRLSVINCLEGIGGEIYSFRLTSNGVVSWRC